MNRLLLIMIMSLMAQISFAQDAPASNYQGPVIIGIPGLTPTTTIGQSFIEIKQLAPMDNPKTLKLMSGAEKNDIDSKRIPLILNGINGQYVGIGGAIPVVPEIPVPDDIKLHINGRFSQRVAGDLGGFGPDDKWSSLGDSFIPIEPPPPSTIYGMINQGFGATFVSGSKVGANNIIGFSGNRLDFDAIDMGGVLTTRVSILKNGNVGIGGTPNDFPVVPVPPPLDVTLDVYINDNNAPIRVRHLPLAELPIVTVDSTGVLHQSHYTTYDLMGSSCDCQHLVDMITQLQAQIDELRMRIEILENP